MKKHYFSILLPFLIIGCGGGGGGGPSTPGYTNIIAQPINNYPVQEPITIIDNTSSTTPISDTTSSSDSLTQEYYASKALSAIKANVAYEQGYTGEGTTIAIIDSGIDKNHSDLSNNIIEGISFVGEIYINGSVYYQTVYSDQLESIKISSGGSGYTTAPKITISGDGTGATAQALLNADGTIKEIVLTNAGTGYTYATVSIDNSGTGGSGLTISTVYLGGDDNSGHGTFIAGIAAAEKDQLLANDPYNNSIQGVAYNASIMSIKVFDNDGHGYISTVQEGIQFAGNNNVDVINLSLGTNYSTGITTSSNSGAYLSALQNDSTIVVAAGNEGLSCTPLNGSLEGRCAFPAALPWITGYSNLLSQNGGWIVVGSVDANNVITSWSNRAGVTASNYLVAPGSNLISTDVNDSYSMGSGTSYSTPIVAGAVALMKEKYPHLTGNQISQILFQTATDLGAPGVDAIYGNGLLNLEAAFAPIGTLSITPQSSSQTTYIGGMVTGKSLGTLNLSSLNNTIALDSYGRDFKVNISSSVSPSDNSKAFSFDDFQIMKFKNLLVGVDEKNQKALIGFNYDTLSFLYSQSDDLYGSSSAGLFGLEHEKTHYFSLRDTFSFLGFNSGYELNYNKGYASPSSGSLISSVDLEGYGYRVFLERNDIGVIYGEEASVRDGNISFNIPTSRNLDGSQNYSSVNITDFQKPQKDITLYKNFKGDNYTLTTGITKKLNKDKLLEDENELLSYLKLNYIF